MNAPVQPAVLTVAYTADGTPYYTPALPQQAAPVLYQPQQAAPVLYQPQPVAQFAPPAPVAYPTAIQAPAPTAGYHVSRDPIVARMVGGGIGVGAAGVGLSFLLNALAAATTALGILAGVLAMIWLLAHTGSGEGRGGAVNVTVSNRMTNRNR